MTAPTQGEHAQTEALRLADEYAAAHAKWALEDLYGSSRSYTSEKLAERHAARAKLERALHAQVAALTAAAVAPKVALELPDGDTRTANVYWSEMRGDTLHLCISVDTSVQPAAPQGVAYAELPDEVMRLAHVAVRECQYKGNDMPQDWMEAAMRACRLLVASNGQAPAGATPDSDAMDEARSNVFDSVIEDLQERVERTNYPGNEIYILALREAIAAIRAAQPFPTTQAAPAAGAVAVPRETLVAWRQWCAQSMSHAIEHEISDWLAAAPTPAAQADSVLEDAAPQAAIENPYRAMTGRHEAFEQGVLKTLAAFRAKHAARKQGAKHD